MVDRSTLALEQRVRVILYFGSWPPPPLAPSRAGGILLRVASQRLASSIGDLHDMSGAAPFTVISLVQLALTFPTGDRRPLDIDQPVTLKCVQRFDCRHIRLRVVEPRIRVLVEHLQVQLLAVTFPLELLIQLNAVYATNRITLLDVNSWKGSTGSTIL